jgi:hypothetical protein
MPQSFRSPNQTIIAEHTQRRNVAEQVAEPDGCAVLVQTVRLAGFAGVIRRESPVTSHLRAIRSAICAQHCADSNSARRDSRASILAVGNGRKLARCKPSGAEKENQMKMKASLLVTAFSLALFIAGCTPAAPVAGPAGPQGAPGQDASRRTDEDKRAEEARRAEDQRITDARARDSHDTGCPGGEHIVTAPDGRKSCARD